MHVILEPFYFNISVVIFDRFNCDAQIKVVLSVAYSSFIKQDIACFLLTFIEWLVGFALRIVVIYNFNFIAFFSDFSRA